MNKKLLLITRILLITKSLPRYSVYLAFLLPRASFPRFDHNGAINAWLKYFQADGHMESASSDYHPLGGWPLLLTPLINGWDDAYIRPATHACYDTACDCFRRGGQLGFALRTDFELLNCNNREIGVNCCVNQENPSLILLWTTKLSSDFIRKLYFVNFKILKNNIKLSRNTSWKIASRETTIVLLN